MDPDSSGGWRFAQCFGDKGEVEDITEGRPVPLKPTLLNPSLLRCWVQPMSSRPLSSTPPVTTLRPETRVGESFCLSATNRSALPPSLLCLTTSSSADWISSLNRFAFPPLPSQKKNCEYKFYTEFQSHEPEFDYLKSLEIEEKINKIKWCKRQNAAHFLLSTNGASSVGLFSHLPSPFRKRSTEVLILDRLPQTRPSNYGRFSKSHSALYRSLTIGTAKEAYRHLYLPYIFGCQR